MGMKVAVSSTGPDLESLLDPRFGRCRYYLIVDTESLAFEAVDNSAAPLS
ncbi:MAG: NifB/NifX family molybdenum-iron cluster-binding protein [Syntrophales bacterium]